MADRGIVHYIEAENQNVDAVPEQGYFTRIIDIIITNLNEFASLETVTTDFDPNDYNTVSDRPGDGSDIPNPDSHSQLSGIKNVKDKAKKAELQALEDELTQAYEDIENQPQRLIPAESANSIIKGVEYLMNNVVNPSYELADVKCEYPVDTVIFPLTMPTIIAGQDQVVFTDDNVVDGTVTATFTVPSSVNVVKISEIGNASCDIEVKDPYGGAGGIVWYDSTINTEDVYVYVDAGENYTLNLSVKNGSEPIVGRGITISYSNDINWGNLPTIADSDNKSGVISITPGSQTITILSSGTTTFDFTPNTNVQCINIHYEGEKLNMYSEIDGQRVSIISGYTADVPDIILPGITEVPSIDVVVSVKDSEKYTITAEGNANDEIEISWSPEINFKKYDVVLGSDYGTEEVQVCTSGLDLVCPNRVYMDGYQDQNQSESPGFVYVCSNPVRQEMRPVSSNSFSISRVSKDEIVYASKWTLISQYLREISSTFDEDSDKNFDEDGLCEITCMVKCQSRCEITCQSCYGGTCHNQHCGGLI